MKRFDVKIAYLSAFVFLDDLFQVKKSDDLGSLLGDMQLLEDDSSADPAAIDDWRNAVESVLPMDNNTQELLLTESEAYGALCEFLQGYVSRTNSQDIRRLIQELIEAKNYPSKEGSLIAHWNATIDFVKNNPESAREKATFRLF